LFLYPALTLGFLFVGVPLLVHLINMLRHRRQRWAAMDFLLASYRKQRKWIHLRQLLLLLSRLVIATLLIAILCGWSGGRGLLDALGGRVTHHVIVLDDSYSMGDRSVDSRGEGGVANVSLPASSNTIDRDFEKAGGVNAYSRALSTLQDLTRYLANQDGEHQLTVMRASRAAMSVRAGSRTGDSAADLSSQSVGEDARLINRIMSTRESAVSVDLVSAIDLASELLRSTPADEKYFYVLSDFREQQWGAADRLAEALRGIGNETPVRLIDCAAEPLGNLAITSLSPSPDVWVAGVPVMMRVSVKNFGKREARNVLLTPRLIQYPDEPIQPDPGASFSGKAEVLPELMIDTLAPGEEVTKTFQVYVAEKGTHAVEVRLPADALSIDNHRVCTLPLSAADRVLIIDGDIDGVGAYHVASSLNPGSQVEVGVLPDVQPPSFLRSIDYETLTGYRAVYLIDLPEIGDNAADALTEYVRRGGGLAWFLGDRVNASSYNQSLLREGRKLLPSYLDQPVALAPRLEGGSGDVLFGEGGQLFGPLLAAGDGILSLVGVSNSWGINSDESSPREGGDYQVCLKRRDGLPLVTQHEFGDGRVMTSLMGLNGNWTNWPGDPTFVVCLLQSNAWLWSAASPPVSRDVESPYLKQMAGTEVLQQATFLPPSVVPPRVPFEMVGKELDAASSKGTGEYLFELDPGEMLIRGDEHLDDVLLPGLAEWGFLAVDGSSRVVPQASVIQQGDGDLGRADHASIVQQLSPINVRFVERRSWNQDEMASGSSAMTLLLILMLIMFLCVEQGLAYWASYHVSPTGKLAGPSRPRTVSGSTRFTGSSDGSLFADGSRESSDKPRSGRPQGGLV